MRTAIISDIHGNYDGLIIALDDLSKRNCDRIICLGDLFEGGKDDDAIVELLHKWNVRTVKGNHDEFFYNEIKPQNLEIVNRFPKRISEENNLYLHISPREKKHKIDTVYEAWNVFDDHLFKICFFGHIHRPVLFGAKSKYACEAHEYEVDGSVIELNKDDRYLVCFGAIGYPRGGGLFIRYGIFDSGNYSIEYIKLNGPLLPFGLNAKFLL